MLELKDLVKVYPGPVAALQGVITQILHRRLHVAPAKARAFISDICSMLIKGMR